MELKKYKFFDIIVVLMTMLVVSCDKNASPKQSNVELTFIDHLMANAKVVDSIQMISPYIYANSNDLGILGCSLQEIEQVYGEHDLVFSSHWELKSVADDDPEYCFSRFFKETEYPVIISGYDWIRDKSIQERLDSAVENVRIRDWSENHNIMQDLKHKTLENIMESGTDMGKCLRIFFVKYKNKEIAFDGGQFDCRRLYSTP
ncbi:MAG: hypothetical protein MJZ14_06225 [Paludibacteraceae bacterium]|nr:hypothetical protein [Paludibacteraceae bacterium]